jgi:aminotransferase
MTRESLQSIAGLAVRHDLIVIADEIYAELTFEGAHVSIANLTGMKERTIFLHGFSKAYAMTGFRLGYACGPAGLIRAMTRIHQYSMLCASIISQEAALEAIRNGEGPMLEMREEYRQRRNFMVNALNAMGLDCHLPHGSFYAFPSVKSTGLSSKEFSTQLLQEENVAAVPGIAFGGCGENFIRCCFATSLEKIELAMERMKRFVTATKKG